MRAVLLTLLSVLLSCSVVVDGRIGEYEGACADEEEAATSRYDDHGVAVAGDVLGARTPLQIALECPACSAQDCVEDCIVSSTSDLSLECGACFADAAICLRGCSDSCSRGRLQERACKACVCQQGCAAPINDCTGLSLYECDVPTD